jgi:uncharacterized protein (DUF983 family)
MSVGTKCKTGFKVPCPHCGAVEGLVLKLHCLVIECSECSEVVDRDDLKQLIVDASRLLNWLDAAASI